MLPSILSKKLPKEKETDMPITKTKHLRKSNMGLPPIITNRHEMVEQQQGKETLYHTVGHNSSPLKEGKVDTSTGEAAQEAAPMIALKSGSHTGDPALTS